MNKTIVFLILFILSGIFYYSITGNAIYEKIETNLTRVIDGDTIETELGKIRLLGLNTPESKEFYYEEAKKFLTELEGKTIEIEFKERDKYNRILSYAFYKNRLLNEEILRQGFANLYYYEKDNYYEKLKNAEEYARKNELGIWKKSSDFNCLELIELSYTEITRCTNQEKLVLKNNCTKNLTITIKDDATHIFHEVINSNSIFTKNFSCIFNDAGDSIYIYDEKGLLIFWRY